jgi:hypothetical protein
MEKGGERNHTNGVLELVQESSNKISEFKIFPAISTQ